MSRTKKITMGFAALAVVCSLLFWKANISETHAAAETVFPEMWNEMELPVVPDTTITEVSQIFQDGKGISIKLESDMPLGDFTKLLEDEFFERDFDIYIPDEESATKYSNTYDSENADVTVNASSDPANPSRSIANIVVKHNAGIPRSLSSQAIKNTSAFYAN